MKMQKYIKGKKFMPEDKIILGFETSLKFNNFRLPALVTTTGCPFSIVISLIVFFIMGSPMTLEYPVLKGFNFKGGMVIKPEAPAVLATKLIEAMNLDSNDFLED